MDEKMVSLRINDIPVTVPEGSTVLEAARSAGFNIPSLCFLKDINEIGACRICVVEVKGARSLVVSCVYPINEGMEVWTNTPKVLESRRKTLQLLLSNHDRKCLSCVRSGNCELQQLCKELGVTDEGYYDGERTPSIIDDSAVHMIRDNSKCILCRRCSAVCEKVQGIGVIGANMRGFATFIGLYEKYFHRFSLVFTIISSVVISGVKQKACSISSSSLQRPDGFPSILLQCAFLIISILEYSLFLLTPARLFFAYSSLKSYKAGLVCLSFSYRAFSKPIHKSPS